MCFDRGLWFVTYLHQLACRDPLLSIWPWQYNRMTEAQERAREKAIAAIRAHADAIGDIATRDKEAAKKRQEQEDARLVEEAVRARVKAKEAEAKERAEVRVSADAADVATD